MTELKVDFQEALDRFKEETASIEDLRLLVSVLLGRRKAPLPDTDNFLQRKIGQMTLTLDHMHDRIVGVKRSVKNKSSHIARLRREQKIALEALENTYDIGEVPGYQKEGDHKPSRAIDILRESLDMPTYMEDNKW